MTDREAEFQKRLLVTFKVEAEDHVHQLASGLVELEGCSEPQKCASLVETVFREAHSLKGAARAVNAGRIEMLCQALESLLAALKRQEVELLPELFDLMQHSVDFLKDLLLAMEGGIAPGKEEQDALTALLHEAARGALAPRLEGVTPAAPPRAEAPSAAPAPETPSVAPATGEAQPAGEPPLPASAQQSGEPPRPEAVHAETIPSAAATAPVLETVKVATSRLTTVLLQAEELLTARLSASQRAAELREVNASFSTWRKEWGMVTPLVDAICRTEENGVKERRTLESQVQRLCDFLYWNASFMAELQERTKQVLRQTDRDARAVGGMVSNLLDDMKKVLMLPFSSLLEIFPKMVRDLARDRGKEVSLTVQGGEIEIDRRILEEMKDPLVHLVRNSIDHGIETPQERQAAGKPPRATIAIAITPKDGSKVELTVCDDGRGIDLSGVRGALRRTGLVPVHRIEELNVAELLSYLFVSGISTSSTVDEISGRGLGLAIVREKVERLSGTLAVETTEGAQTLFRMTLPLTVSSFRVVLVRVADHFFAFPAAHVEQVARVKSAEIGSAEGKEMIRFKGRIVPLVRLAGLLGIAPDLPGGERVQVVLATMAEKTVAYQVDEVLNEQEVLAKNLGLQISRLPNVTGATILGSGRVVPILNVSDLMSSTMKGETEKRGVLSSTAAPEEVKTGLIAEDSITSRTLLKNILESAGYRVSTAVDGVDAFTQLKSGGFDFLISDVDMPRMNGIDLTAKVRGDHDLAELPVILVTSLDSQADRERGMDVGASAYIVKGRFDQSDLLEAIRRLV
ncbi:hybrid sensor histidine kinase/response regulator [Geomonas sp. RF6]|uniref:hybrid sensor histidine kinase/response regulator n=1 Tax=Geomonas sp. RF6 TaxID=2897342 RepID=UPI001E478217|nr:hybrid sensor histidine kinase/response regulator [Geomonas sp. RF6]UFS69419.1 hybrid sensor histidine kinase/response regulator [Geomonas sp. RF6]